jgi:hypothetical protein
MAIRDRREEILERLDTLLQSTTITLSSGVIPAGNYVHNRNELPAALVPGIILLDGDESNDPRTLRQPGLQQNQVPVQLIRMTPEIYVVLDERKPLNLNVGADLNLARRVILATIWPDRSLQASVGSNGNIVYDGCVTDLARNRTMQGQLGMSITFTYPIGPMELVG